VISTSSHKIQTIILDIHFEGFDIGLGMQDDLADYFYITIQPEMEKIMDAKAGNESYLKIKNLSLDCGTIPYEHWEKNLVEAIKRNLSYQLQALSGTKISMGKNFEEHQWNKLLYFLKKGYYPWSSSLSAGTDISLSLTKVQLLEFAQHYKYSSNFSKRFTASISPKVKVSLLNAFLKYGDTFTKRLSNALLVNMKGNSKMYNWVLHSINDVFLTHQSIPLSRFITTLLSHTVKSKKIENKGFAVMAESMIKMSNEYPPIINAFETVFEEQGDNTFRQNRFKLLQLLYNKNKQVNAGQAYQRWMDQIQQDQQIANGKIDFDEDAHLGAVKLKANPSDDEITDNDSLFIANAGIVILHPFLPAFFEEIEGLTLEENKKVCLDNCLEMLEYLVYGNNEHGEQYYPFNKILCGRNVEDVFVPSKNLSMDMIDKADSFLKEVISHWKVLKNPSLEGFRETFLQRNGKLTQVSKGWKLEVEKKGVDILMGSLPWGLGIIKLPWTEKIIYVEWN